ncbi:hypothetical protein WDU94_015480 [Cyamophila willieti]
MSNSLIINQHVTQAQYVWADDLAAAESRYGTSEQDKAVLMCTCNAAQRKFGMEEPLPCDDYWNYHLDKQYQENVFLILAPYGIQKEDAVDKYIKLMDTCAKAEALSKSTVECFSNAIQAENGALPKEEFRMNWLNSNLDDNNRILKKIGVKMENPFTNIPSEYDKARSAVDQIFVHCEYENGNNSYNSNMASIMSE